MHPNAHVHRIRCVHMASKVVAGSYHRLLLLVQSPLAWILNLYIATYEHPLGM